MSIEIGTLIAFAGALLGIVFSYLNWKRDNYKDVQTDALGAGELRSDISYIKRGIEDIKVDLKVQEKQLREHSERITRLEESSKQAHKRIDKIEGR